ncbi:TetR/AcrR family transcriptional regulator [Antarcticimicrobium sediminis]|uniref:TetR/AcrR family transcriptional regulator n=1 Tax=Antarcticimicrobium sediminis TaxID=2546227 RepID=UPI00140452F9|nr:TetR/AcrR family transcriptional regulator [Antarcticimicrobium sediminis]
MTEKKNSSAGKTSKPQQERSAETHQKLIRAAISVLAQRGYANFSTSMVAEKAKVSRGALQYHFQTRDDILVAARDYVARALNLPWKPETLRERPVDERIRMIIDHYWTFIGSKNYIAALEVRLYERFNRSMHKTLLERMNKLTGERNAEWQEIFSDTGLSPDYLIPYRLYMLDCLRGLALRRIEQGAGINVTPQIEILTDLMIKRISS